MSLIAVGPERVKLKNKKIKYAISLDVFSIEWQLLQHKHPNNNAAML